MFSICPSQDKSTVLADDDDNDDDRSREPFTPAICEITQNYIF